MCELCCKQCKVPLCSKCLSSNLHKGHDYEHISDVFDAQKACIGRERDEMNSIIQKFKEFNTKLDTKSKDRERIYKTLESQVSSREKDMMAALKKAVTKQRQKIKELKTMDQNQLQAEKDKIDQQITKTRESVDYCDKLLDGQNPSGLIQFSSKISDLQNLSGVIPDMNEYIFKTGSLSNDDIDGGFGEIELKQKSEN
ncbi:E3 ubiquitin-protein ligase TRIM9-like [Saccostrea cucullata]|uniref:E3 ubiquitin-protein ligase TRIM9-like n=1 Tax=Saccostrea cuccullata TaxID=36930 RepID=UPI002ED6BF1B